MTFMDGLMVGMVVGFLLREYVLPFAAHRINLHRHARVARAMTGRDRPGR